MRRILPDRHMTDAERGARHRARARAAIEACERIADPAAVRTLAEARRMAIAATTTDPAARQIAREAMDTPPAA